ncbi:MAG: hypothetical protein KDE47_11200 [Caldilineaceae bacterium]|nr:hypothetical protein [Caldilineaceae bacterium]
MARPRLDCPVVKIPLTLSLRVGEDDDLIAFFAHNDQTLNISRASAVMAALRAGGIGSSSGGRSEDDDELGDLLAGMML